MTDGPPISVGGKRFPSCAVAAAYFGMAWPAHPQTIREGGGNRIAWAKDKQGEGLGWEDIAVMSAKRFGARVSDDLAKDVIFGRI